MGKKYLIILLVALLFTTLAGCSNERATEDEIITLEFV